MTCNIVKITQKTPAQLVQNTKIRENIDTQHPSFRFLFILNAIVLFL